MMSVERDKRVLYAYLLIHEINVGLLLVYCYERFAAFLL